MTTRRMTLDDLPAAIKRQAALIPQAALIAMRRAARRGESCMVALSAGFVDTGVFMNAWDVEDGAEGATLLNDAPHAGVIEEGRRPAYPPLLPIFEHLGRKTGVSTAGITETARWDLSDHPMFQGMTSLDSDVAPEIELLRRHAVALGRWLGTHNIPGKHVMTNALPRFRRFAREELEKALNEAERRA